MKYAPHHSSSTFFQMKDECTGGRQLKALMPMKTGGREGDEKEEEVEEE